MTLLSRSVFQPQKRVLVLAPPCTSTKEMSIILPVKNNQAGVTRFLTELLRTHPPSLYPREVIIVDNHSMPPLALPSTLLTGELCVTVLSCARPGPASARNVGTRHARTAWVVFTDSDCLPAPTFLTGYLEATSSGAVGYAGTVQAWKQDRWSRYYDSQAI
ncbi:MAG TPA: glycosyltransferase [Ktedonobacterales bacterium]|nr:glycosyltransferase [Ktedonobacterales bacterium]